jgi:hypothetical protein
LRRIQRRICLKDTRITMSLPVRLVDFVAKKLPPVEVSVIFLLARNI